MTELPADASYWIHPLIPRAARASGSTSSIGRSNVTEFYTLGDPPSVTDRCSNGLREGSHLSFDASGPARGTRSCGVAEIAERRDFPGLLIAPAPSRDIRT